MTAGPLMLDLVGTELSNDERELLLRPAVGGVIFFARNAASRDQIAALSAEIKALRPALLLAVDQEGGRVQRLREGYSLLPPMQLLGDLYRRDEEEGSQLLHDCGWLMAAEVIASGIDFSFAPVLDLDRDHCEVIANRAFGDEPALASRAIQYFIDGMHEAGMAATGKHFPGHGGVVGDSHLETPVDPRELETLREHDLQPFKILAPSLQAVMPAHIVFPNIDAQAVGFSDFWLQEILRKELDFQGLIFSDDLSMKGADVAGGYQQKAALALAAGCDMVLVCNNRAGALSVLEFLEARVINDDDTRSTVDNLSAMKAQRSWVWSELETNARRQSIIETLKRIV
ncbi:MAG: beta-N-acetylhexosaminidase [Porticoccaceae bacterium]|nr:beta-N-acetylhexosaminidase [Porticoccaceae bacterium]